MVTAARGGKSSLRGWALFLKVPSVLVGLFILFPFCAWPAWVGGVSGSSAIMAGTAGDDSLRIRTQGSSWLAHDRYVAGDPGFESSLDFDSGITGEQRIPNNGTGSVALFAGAGSDTLYVTDGYLINPNNRLQIESGSIKLGAEAGGNRPIITHSGFTNINLFPQTPSNGGVEFVSTEAGVNYRISGSETQFYRIGTFEVGSLDAIQGPIAISNGGIVNIEDGKDTSNNTYTVDSSNRITRSGSASLDLFLTKQITFFAGNGENQFYIKGNSTPDFRIFSGQNNSSIAFGGDDRTLDRFPEPVALNNFNGANTIISFNDAGAKSGHQYTLDSGYVVRNTSVIAYGVNAATILYCGAFNDTVWAEPGPRMHVEAGTGNDTDLFVVNAAFNPGLTTVNGDSSTISDPSFLPITFSGINQLFLFGDAVANSFAVTPSATYPIFIDGTDPVASPGDSLKLEAGGLPFILAQDSFLVYGKRLVSFLGFESVEGPQTPPPPPPPPASGADLTGTFVSASVAPSGQKTSIVAQFDQKNIGNLDAPKTVVQFFLSADATASPDDLPLKSKKLKVVPANQQRTVLLKKKLPATTSTSGKYIIAVVTHSGTTPDINPGNNTLVFGPLL